MKPQTPPQFRDPPYSGLLLVSGEGSKNLLQGQLTCDVNSLNDNDACLGAHCNRSGKIISLFWLSQHNGHYRLNMPRELVPQALKALQRYAVFYKNVRLSDDSHALQNAATPLTTLRSGLPALYPDTSEKFFAHELNLNALGAISFEKGCYTGQEIIARMHYRGKIKTGLQHVSVIASLAPVRGSDIFNASGACGTIVDCVTGTNNHHELLVIAPTEQTILFMDEAHTFPLMRN